MVIRAYRKGRELVLRPLGAYRRDKVKAEF